ncbi:hypothetical protein, partial [Thermus oshimai]|uniref:hypothetical protein n=1 Tax=Thermus oshimai TaxID=56957 RepID=UPI001FE22E51
MSGGPTAKAKLFARAVHYEGTVLYIGCKVKSMGKRHAWLPKSKEIIVRKEFILDALEKLDQDP